METKVKQKLIDMGVNLERRLGVAVSGGVDSMVLLSCLLGMNVPVVVYHMEHGIRGQQSRDDMAFVKAQCAKFRIECITASVDVPAIAKKQGVSVETAARIARYEFLDAAQIDHIATAHHMDDMAETVIMNLIRGSGLLGLCGIPEKRGKYIRPMLGISRDEIEKYAKDNDITHVVDSTNDDISYTRNYIRKQILPRLKQINGASTANIARSARLLSEDEKALMGMAKSVDCIKVSNDGVLIDLALMTQQMPAVQKRIIRLAISCKYDLADVENVHIDSILQLVLGGQSGKSINLKYGLIAVLAYDKLIVGKTANKRYNDKLVILSEQGNWQMENTAFESAVQQSKDKLCYGRRVEYFDADIIDGAVLRHRKEADYIVPLGMSGTKRLSDYLSDRKVPLNKRDSLLVMAKCSEIFWVVGVGVSNTSKVTDTSRVLKIKYEEKEYGQ